MIDPEFAFYGPMGFDLGALIGNLLLAYCAVPGNGQGDDYAEWLLQQVNGFCGVCQQCLGLETSPTGRGGFLRVLKRVVLVRIVVEVSRASYSRSCGDRVMVWRRCLTQGFDGGHYVGTRGAPRFVTFFDNGLPLLCGLGWLYVLPSPD